MTRLAIAPPLTPKRELLAVTAKPSEEEGKSETLRDRAYESLRRLLILRRIPEGEPLRELRWATRLQVNRTALREALSRLHSEGMVVEGAKAGYCVPRFTPEDLEDIREVRAIVESAAIHCLIRKGRSRSVDLAPLRALCDELEWILSRDYAIELVEADHRFHEMLVQLSGNRRLQLVHRCLPQAVAVDIRNAPRDWRPLAVAMLTEHRAILDAIQRKRGAEAAALLQRHYS